MKKLVYLALAPALFGCSFLFTLFVAYVELNFKAAWWAGPMIIYLGLLAIVSLFGSAVSFAMFLSLHKQKRGVW